MDERDVASIVSGTQAYYDGPADEIYRTVWGDNLHLGVPCGDECPHPEAMEHTNEIMAKTVSLGPEVRVLDLGCGYGSTARYLAANFGCRVTGANISDKELELELARSRSIEASLDNLLSFEYGDFHRLGYPDWSYDVVWSQEAFLHAADKTAVLSECRRSEAGGFRLLVAYGTWKPVCMTISPCRGDVIRYKQTKPLVPLNIWAHGFESPNLPRRFPTSATVG